MPVINADGCPIHVVVDGRDDAPVLMLSNSLGTTHRMWDDQVRPFTQHVRLVRYDRRGHGQSGCPQGPYNMERLGRDAEGVVHPGAGDRAPREGAADEAAHLGERPGDHDPER